MFTGLVSSVESVISKKLAPSGKSAELVISRMNSSDLNDAKIGDSIAINGCCLTIVSLQKNQMAFDVSTETLAVTNLGSLETHTKVNVEGALRMGDRLGGHFVQGHVDGLATLVSFEKSPDGSDLIVTIPKTFSKYFIKKGSACLDGVSLTINDIIESRDVSLRFTIIPATLRHTTFGNLPKAWKFNLEADLLAKHIERLGSHYTSPA